MSNLVFPALTGLLPGVRRGRLQPSKTQTAASGKRYTIRRWLCPVHTYDLDFNYLRTAVSTDEFQQLLNFVAIHGGQKDSFLYTDPPDSSVTAHKFGPGNASTVAFQLQRTLSTPGASPTFWPSLGSGYEPVWEPNSAPLIYKDTGGGPVLQTLTTHYTVGANGLITFVTAPAAGASLTWTGTYYRRVQFDQESVDLEQIVFGAWKGSVKLIEVIP